MTPRLIRLTSIAAALFSVVLVVVVGANSTRWLGATFPGFFVMANRVVPSIALPSWGASPARLFQHQVIAVEGEPVTTSTAVYERVAQQPPGSAIHYTLRAPDGGTATLVVRSRQFTANDYIWVFGAFLITGITFIIVALTVAWCRPESTASLGLLCSGLSLGVFALTATDLYGPHWFFRLHVVAEALFPAAFIHLAMVFPSPRLARGRSAILVGVYVAFVLLAILYEYVLYWPSAYTAVHLTASVAHALCGVAILAAVLFDRFATASPLVRWRAGVVAAGAVTAFVGPTVLMAASGLFGGRIAVNGAALTAFIFPLSIAYALLRRDSLGGLSGPPIGRQSGIIARHLFSAGIVGGIFLLMVVGMHGPHWLLRLRVIAAALMPATLIHLALVFRTPRLRLGQVTLLAGVYVGCAILAGFYELGLRSAAAHHAAHLVTSTAQATAALVLIWAISYDLLTTRSGLVGRRILIAALTAAALLLPSATMATARLWMAAAR